MHALAWSLVPHGTSTPTVTLAPGLVAQVLVAGGKAQPPGGAQAELLEGMLMRGTDELGDEIDLHDSGRLAAVREAVVATFDSVRRSLAIPEARARVDADQATVLGKLAELAA